MSGPRSILVSAGETSGDFYAAQLVAELRRRWPDCRFFGCAGKHLRAQGVHTVIRAEDLAVVGLVEVIGHIPRIYMRFRELVAAALREKPDLAILTDSPDFHFRVAAKLKRLKVPVVWLVAPQVWAWRKGRVKTMRRIIDRLLCIFPFEEKFFTGHGISAGYIGHPLSTRVRPTMTRDEFFRKHNLPGDRPLVAVLPGSRQSEALRHLPDLIGAAGLIDELLVRESPASFVLPASPTCGVDFFAQSVAGSQIRAIDGEAWDAIAHCDVALAASGTVTIEAALLGAPMVTFYKVKQSSWVIGRWLVDVPFFSMVNLVAEKRVVPELIQGDMSAASIAREASRLLHDPGERERMKKELAGVAERLSGDGTDAIVRAADEVQLVFEKHA